MYCSVTGGHLDVVQLLVSAGADIDSQDNRKVSCLMASFRKGHVKVSKWMVKHVNQFPSDQELSRYIATVSDKVNRIYLLTQSVTVESLDFLLALFSWVPLVHELISSVN